MDSMVMTLCVSRLSGWLNATACCRVEIKRGHTMQGEVRACRREVAGDRGAGSVHGRAANKEDALCKSKGRHAMRGEVQTGRQEVAADRGARIVQGRARLQIGSRARGRSARGTCSACL